MGDEAINNAMKIILAKKKIIKELEKNKENIFSKVLDELFTKYKNEEYIYDLKDENFIQDFKTSIINGHFQWILDKLKNENQTTFNSKYIINENNSLLNVPYCHFYSILITQVKKMELSPFAQDILKKYINDLIQKYCN